MQTTTEKTVREIALENPSSIRVFETLGIDYCCGGKRPLTEACTRANINYDRALQLLEKAKSDAATPAAGEWTKKPLAAIVAHIVGTHHAYVRQETPRIGNLLTKVISKHGASHPEVIQIEQLFSAIGQELATHMLKEEQVLFPYIVRMEEAVKSGEPVPAAFFGSVKRPIANMVADHDDAGALLAQIRELSRGYTAPEGACPTFLALSRGLEEFERDLHHHVHLENNILFPRALHMEQGTEVAHEHH
jgi:regulator of cell morphogenesis and NO signaling